MYTLHVHTIYMAVHPGAYYARTLKTLEMN